jgi:hypothetical protein
VIAGVVLSPQIVTSGSPATATPRGIILATPAAAVEGGDGVKGEGPELRQGALVWHGTAAWGRIRSRERVRRRVVYEKIALFYLHTTLYARDCI